MGLNGLNIHTILLFSAHTSPHILSFGYFLVERAALSRIVKLPVEGSHNTAVVAANEPPTTIRRERSHNLILEGYWYGLWI
jgi:hypothetical protein